MSTSLSDPTSERALLGACIIAPVKIAYIRQQGCCKQWFTSEHLQQIWELLVAMHQKQMDINLVSFGAFIRQAIQSTSEASAIDSETIKCVEACLGASYTQTYLELVRDFYDRRQVKAAIDEHEALLSTTSTPVGVAGSLTAKLMTLDLYKPQFETNEMRIERIMAATERNTKGISFVPSRWVSLQNVTGGSRRGKLHTWAARPGNGKSTVMCNEVRTSVRNGHPVYVASLEMNTDELFTKMACDAAQLDSFKFITRTATNQERQALRKALVEISQMPLVVDDKPGVTIGQLVSRIQTLRDRQKIESVWIDYIQLIRSEPHDRRNRREQITEFCEQLAMCAKICDVSINILCQLSRLADQGVVRNSQNGGKQRIRPTLSMLKESGAIEESSYSVILLYPSDPEDLELGKDDVPYIWDLAKHRGGPTGPLNMRFRKSFNRFEERT